MLQDIAELCIGSFREPRQEHPSFSANQTGASGWVLENHCSAGLHDDDQPSIGVVCGSDNHMFELLHNIHRTAYRASAAIDRVGFGHGGAHIDAVSCLLESHGCPGPAQAGGRYLLALGQPGGATSNGGRCGALLG